MRVGGSPIMLCMLASMNVETGMTVSFCRILLALGVVVWVLGHNDKSKSE